MIGAETIDHIDWTTWTPDEKASLCFVKDGSRILLIHKKTGLGAGRISAPGGRLEAGETAVEAAYRETVEEVRIAPGNLRKFGELSFQFRSGYALHGTVFLATEHTGVPAETEEAEPFWCEIDKIPYDQMWQDDPYWLPMILRGNQIRGFLLYDDNELVSSRVFVF